MSANIIFDTHAYVKRLTEAGVAPRAAEVIAKGQVEFLNENVATKHDIELLRQETKLEIVQLEAKLIAAIADSQFKIIVWNVGALFAFGSLALAVNQFL